VSFALLLWLGAGHQRVNAWDSAFLLDGGWRVFSGQRPHVDFYSPFGAVPSLVVALGMAAAGPKAAALGYGSALLLPVAGVWAWAVARRRFSALPALLFCLTVAFLLVGTHRLDLSWRATTYAMSYNRMGWALLALLVVQLFVPRRGPRSRRVELLEGLSLGLLLGILLFLKITYFGAAAGALALSALLYPRSRREWLAAAGVLAAVVLAMTVYLRFDLGAFVADMRMLAGAQDQELRLDAARRVLSLSAWSLAGLGLAASLAVLSLRARRPRPRWSAWGRPLAAVTGVAVMGLAVCSANQQAGRIPLFGVAGLVLLASLAPSTRGREARRPAPVLAATLGCLLLVLALFIPPLARDVAGVGYSVAWKALRASETPSGARIDAAPLRDLVLPPGPREPHERAATIARILARDPEVPGLTSFQYAAWVDDGLALLRRHAKPDSGVLCLDWFNPFPFALGAPSPRGDALAWHYGLLVDYRHRPEPERVFAEADLVMEPKRAVAPSTLEFKRNAYAETLQRDFVVREESALWTLYTRRPGR